MDNRKSTLHDKDKHLYWLDESHPNYERWKRSRDLAEERAKLIEILVAGEGKISGKLMLDVGSGIGGTAAYFNQQNSVVSLDINYLKMQEGEFPAAVLPVCADANFLPLKPEVFDIIILQDVIEHVELSANFFKNLQGLLKPDGILYISTPNRTSILNILSDPHWGFPFVALMSRRSIQKHFLPLFRKQEINRTGIAQLFSLDELVGCTSGLWYPELCTVEALQALFSGNKGVVWSDFHLLLIKLLRLFRLNTLLLAIANNKKGILNRYFTPTFYCVCKKLL